MVDRTILQDTIEPASEVAGAAKPPFEEPKLTFIEPQLVKHGDATKITKNGFFGTFVP